MSEAAAGFVGDLEARYEKLRADVLAERKARRRDHGWFVLVSRGMAAWMRTFSKGMTDADTENARAGDGTSPAGLSAEMVVVLAEMIFDRAVSGGVGA